MRVLFILILTIVGYQPIMARDTDLDTLMQRVLNQYSISDYFEYEGLMQRYDSSHSKKFQEVIIYHKFQRPNYHINFGNQLESMQFGNYRIEVNHRDSLIIVGKVKDSLLNVNPKASLDEFIKNLTSIESRLSIEKEDSFFVLIRIHLEKFPSHYMSFKVDKRSALIVQNQFYKGELAYGKTKFYFYQIDYFKYKKEENRKLDMNSVIEKMENKNLTFSTRYKNYKIKYLNK
jgi:hypothetical protein